MITTRPLLPDAFTASWIELPWQRWKSFWFRSSMYCAWASVILMRGCVGRRTYPLDFAIAIDVCTRWTESDLQTTRVFGSLRADGSDRGVGTWPPAHGDTEQS